VWFALGEVLAICIGDVGQAGVLICMPAFCVLWGSYGEKVSAFAWEVVKKINEMRYRRSGERRFSGTAVKSENGYGVRWLWLGYLMLVFGFSLVQLFTWNMQAEKTVDSLLSETEEDSVYVTAYGVIEEMIVKEDTDDETAEEGSVSYNVVVDLKRIQIKNEAGDEIVICDNCKVIIYGADCEYKLGSSVSLTGDMYVFEKSENPGCFDMKRYYQSRGISFYMYDCDMEVLNGGYNHLKQALYEFKNACSKRLKMITDADTANIYRGILLGDKYDIDSSIKMSFQLVGIGHILAISGLHISMLAGLIYKLLKKTGLKNYAASPITISILVLYGMMTGFGVATIRAVVMMALMLTGELLGRDYDILTADGLALFIMLIENPYRIYDSGMWLSVVAVVGVYAGLKISKLFMVALGQQTRKLKKLVLEKIISSIVVSLSINLATFPVMLLLYYQFCPYSVMVNLIIIPLMSVVVVCGIIGLVITGYVSMVTVALGSYAIYPGASLLRFYMKLCDMTMKLPGYVINTGKPDFVQVIVYYAVMFAVYILLFGRKVRKRALKTKKYSPGRGNILRACAVFALGVGIIFGSCIYNDRERMIFMSVGQGDAIAIRTGDGVNICVDGGSTSKSETGRYIIAPCLKSQRMARVDYWFVSHTDEDHISGLTEMISLGKLSGVQIRNIVFSKYVVQDDNYEELCELAEEAGVNIIYMDYLDILGTDEFKLTCYHPEEADSSDDKNAASLVLCYESDLVTLWLTGDVGADGMDDIAEELQGEDTGCAENEQTENDVEEKADGTKGYNVVTVNENEHITILKMPHHGSKYSISEEFYAGISPDVAVISCGRNNLYGHPHTETMETLDEYGIPSLITWQSGAVVVETRKGSVSVTGYGK
jgi:competence protein ComEC